MDWNEQKRNANPIFVEPEMIEDIPLPRREKVKEGMRNIRRRAQKMNFLKVGMAMAAAVLVLALLAAPILPFAALIFLLVRSCRSAFRAQTA